MQLLSHVKLSTAFVQSITSQRAPLKNSLKYANNRLNMAAAYLLSFMLTLDVYIQRSQNDGAKTLGNSTHRTHTASATQSAYMAFFPIRRVVVGNGISKQNLSILNFTVTFFYCIKNVKISSVYFRQLNEFHLIR